MSKITLIQTETNGFGETINGDRYSIPATIEKVSREAVTEERNERKGYDLVCLVKYGDVKNIRTLDIMNDDLVVVHDGKNYEPAKIEEQYGFGGNPDHYCVKARLQ